MTSISHHRDVIRSLFTDMWDPAAVTLTCGPRSMVNIDRSTVSSDWVSNGLSRLGLGQSGPGQARHGLLCGVATCPTRAACLGLVRRVHSSPTLAGASWTRARWSIGQNTVHGGLGPPTISSVVVFVNQVHARVWPGRKGLPSISEVSSPAASAW